MRNVFNALAKIIGLWMVSLGLLNLTGALGGTTRGGSVLVCFYIIAACVRFLLAWVLIFKTDWVADKLKVPQDEDPFKPLEKSALFSVGIQLVGLYFFLFVVHDLMRVLGEAYAIVYVKKPLLGFLIARGLPATVGVFLSVMCILKADNIVKIIVSKADAKWIKQVAVILLVITALSILVLVLKSTQWGVTWSRSSFPSDAQWEDAGESEVIPVAVEPILLH